ncbi:hypothetical protein SteCoe_2598 [Stentor coeruleus]|uniref:Uncharacterized protein n=1 Tax=Stentor coeruleus TaxID=5963 RepID=A0A1R2CZ29_9CILI|nr:hypothetical protein SteCoe_2598 [Stentor coeruleus]
MYLHILPRPNSNHTGRRTRKLDFWNRLHTSIPVKRKTHKPIHILKVGSVLKSQQISNKIIAPVYFPSSSALPSKSRALKTPNSTHTKQFSILSFDDLLLLEEDLFKEKPHFRLKTNEVRRTRKDNGSIIELKGIKMNFSSGKSVENKNLRPASNKSFVRVGKNPISFSRRAYSVNKSSGEMAKNDTPGPWDNGLDNLNNVQKSLDYDIGC